ncbi:MAG TPA: Gfo/Idh/MocA family oxidoreductase [Verrucomicrobiales bacterium]|nr:Gfo/Idh/MocA family oxidoreductase [Verrucomicrobiales bacterium]HIL69005.1 Gfo/Idh/MocA family oxidoreductase [Verrucomicrobiota bacterium]
MNSLNPQSKQTSRRHFLKSSTTAAAGAAFTVNLSFPQKTFAVNSDTLKVGLIGCGGRGTGAARQALNADKNVILSCMADVFEDHLENRLKSLKASNDISDRVQVDPDHRFTGFDAYKKVLESDVDVVILTTPPGFRPLHLEAAVQAGKHIFCEKPMAVDAPGVRKVLAAAKQAKAKGLSLASGFCWRAHFPKRETFNRVLDGSIGEVRTIYNTYLTGALWNRPTQPHWSEMRKQMRMWYYYTWLSGDHIVEQAIHSIDMMSWAFGDKPPARITATGGRQERTQKVFGHIYDHFAVIYEYDNGERGFHISRQQPHCSGSYAVEMSGSKGHCTVDCSRGRHEITGAVNWSYGRRDPQNDMYQTEHDEFFKTIRDGNPMNQGESMAQSTMMAIAGRMAAYTGQSLTWDQVMNSKEDLSPSGYTWDTPITAPQVAIPGVTKFV